jgi:hypothetical protein
MFLPILGRFRVCKDGYEWAGTGSGKTRIVERGIAKWQSAPATTNMAVEIANIDLENDTGVSSFLEQWGLPIIKDETKPASMPLADIHELVRNVRASVAHASRHDEASFKIQFDKHAFFAARPRTNPKGEPAMFVECRDPAAMAWLQLAQKERINAEYRACGWCDAFFVVSGSEGHRRSRRFCSDRCRVAANRATNRD